MICTIYVFEHFKAASNSEAQVVASMPENDLPEGVSMYLEAHAHVSRMSRFFISWS